MFVDCFYVEYVEEVGGDEVGDGVVWVVVVEYVEGLVVEFDDFFEGC